MRIRCQIFTGVQIRCQIFNFVKAYLVDGARTRGRAKRVAGACWGRPAATKQDRERRSAGGGGHPLHLGRHRSKERGSCRSGHESRRIIIESNGAKCRLRGRIRDLLFPSDPLSSNPSSLSIYLLLYRAGAGAGIGLRCPDGRGGFPQGSAQDDAE